VKPEWLAYLDEVKKGWQRRLSRKVAALAADFACRAIGHDWILDGGRACPKSHEGCSQTVYRCRRCGEYDYGYEGGPAHKDCVVCPWDNGWDGRP